MGPIGHILETVQDMR